MHRRNVEVVGVRRTGWAALDRDPQQDTVEFVCPHCGAQGQKKARRERALYHFTDGFLQDLQGKSFPQRRTNSSTKSKSGAQLAAAGRAPFFCSNQGVKVQS